MKRSNTKTLEPPPSGMNVEARRPRPRRRIRTVAATGAGGRRSGPATPLLRWKFDDAEKPPQEKPRRKRRNAAGGGGGGAAAATPGVSARRLAAGIWHLQLMEVGNGGGDGRGRGRGGSENIHGHLQAPHACNPERFGLNANKKIELTSPVSSIHNPEISILHKMEGAALPNSVMERATKWDPGCSKASDEVYRFYSHMKLLEDQQVSTVSVVSALQAELEQARNRVSELETERRSAKKKLDHFLRKLAEEKTAWRSREHEKIRAIMDDIKTDLNRERKNRQRMEIVNSKLVNELAEAKLSAKRLLQDYEKERKARELMEEVCDELAKEIGEDKAEVEALKREAVKVREEVEEERKMLQMAEVWREERVQMKLIDAKLTLDEKYTLLSKLQANLEAFMRSRSNCNGDADAAEMGEAELLMEAFNSVKVQETKEFTYQPPSASEDIFAIFEELQPRNEANEREIQQCYGYSPASHASKVHTVSPDTNGFLEKPTVRYTNGMTHGNGEVEDDSGWETVSHVEEQGSSNSLDGSDPSVNGICEESNASVSGTDWEENGDHGRLNSEISEVCSATTRQTRKKMSSIVRLWRSGDNNKKIVAEAINGRISNGRMSNATVSPDCRSGEVGLSPGSIGQWSSPDSVNPHITRGMKGCIEWPRGAQKHSLKAKLLEARMESQKIQLRQVLKQKI